MKPQALMPGLDKAGTKGARRLEPCRCSTLPSLCSRRDEGHCKTTPPGSRHSQDSLSLFGKPNLPLSSVPDSSRLIF